MLLKCFLKSQFNIDVNMQDKSAPFTNFQFEVARVWKVKQRLVQIPGCQEISVKK